MQKSPSKFADDRPKAPSSTNGHLRHAISLTLGESTFVGAKAEPIHRWYKLRPSFSPTLVRMLSQELGNDRPLFDPYSGAGTTVIEGKRLGLGSTGIEINPFLRQLSQYALCNGLTISDIERGAKLAIDAVRQIEARGRDPDLEEVVGSLNISIPPIHNPFRWWRRDVLAKLLSVKWLLTRFPQTAEPGAYLLLWVALATECIEAANIKRLHPTLTFHERPDDLIDVYTMISDKIREISSDLRIEGYLSDTSDNKVLLGDTARAHEIVTLDDPVNLVTSPPYPNRYSYVWETRPHLFMMDLVTSGSEATELDLLAPGGTWGRATSVLSKGEIAPLNDAIRQLISPVATTLRLNDNLMANYVVKYFNMMYSHLESLARVLPRGSRFAFVIGNSRIKDVDVDSAQILAQLIDASGLGSVDKLTDFRKRIGRRGLSETAIIGTKH